ncbi:MAG: DUF5677 domain-containing protein [Actinomycetota bacterium]|nr:DUF5677 domain-containing protein [Actinomycetota bacterium]
MAQDSNLWGTVRELLRQVEQTLRSSYPRGEISIARPDEATLSMYWRCVSLFRSVLILLDNGFPEEALILARSLFEESLRLMELEDAGDERKAILFGYYAENLERSEELFGPTAERLGITKDASDVREHARRQKGQIESYRIHENIGKRKKFSTVKVAASKLNRQRDLWIYLLSHYMVHGGEPAYIFRRGTLKEGARTFYAQTSDPDVLAETGAFAARSIAHAQYATAGMFGWEISPELPKLIDDLNQRADAS